MTLLTLRDVQARVLELAARIGATGYVLPTFGHSEDLARPYVEIHGVMFHYLVKERGQLIREETTLDLDELLWFVFRDVTSALSSTFAAENPVPDRDFRRGMFAKQLELLAVLSPEWAARAARRHEEILRRYPFHDAAEER